MECSTEWHGATGDDDQDCKHDDVDEFQRTLISQAVAGARAELRGMRAEICAEIASDLSQVIADMRAEIVSEVADTLADVAHQAGQVAALEQRVRAAEEVAELAKASIPSPAHEDSERADPSETPAFRKLEDAVGQLGANFGSMLGDTAEQYEKMQQMDAHLQSGIDDLRSHLQEICSHVEGSFERRLSAMEERMLATDAGGQSPTAGGRAGPRGWAGSRPPSPTGGDLPARSGDLQALRCEVDTLRSKLPADPGATQIHVDALAAALDAIRMQQAGVEANVSDALAGMAQQRGQLAALEEGLRAAEGVARSAQELASDAAAAGSRHVGEMMAQLEGKLDSSTADGAEWRGALEQVADRIGFCETRLGAVEDAATAQHVGEAVAMLGANVDGLIRSIAEQGEQVQEMGMCLRSEIDGIHTRMQETSSSERWNVEDLLAPLRERLEEVAAQRGEIATEVTDALSDVAQHADRVAGIERRLGAAEEAMAAADERDPAEAARSQPGGDLEKRLEAVEEAVEDAARSAAAASAGLEDDFSRRIAQLESGVAGLASRGDERHGEHQQFRASFLAEVDAVRLELQELASNDARIRDSSESLYAQLDKLSSWRDEIKADVSSAIMGMAEHANQLALVERRLCAAEEIAPAAFAAASRVEALGSTVAKIEGDVGDLLAQGAGQHGDQEHVDELREEVEALHSQCALMSAQVTGALADIARHAERTAEVEARVAATEDTAQSVHSMVSGAVESTNGWAKEVHQLCEDVVQLGGSIDGLVANAEEQRAEVRQLEEAFRVEVSDIRGLISEHPSLDAESTKERLQSLLVHVEAVASKHIEVANEVADAVAEVEQHGGHFAEIERRLAAAESLAQQAQEVASGAVEGCERRIVETGAFADALTVQQLGEAVAKLGSNVDGLITINTEQRDQVQQMGACFRGEIDDISGRLQECARKAAADDAGGPYADLVTVQQLGEAVTRLGSNVDGLIAINTEQRDQVRQMGVCFRGEIDDLRSRFGELPGVTSRPTGPSKPTDAGMGQPPPQQECQALQAQLASQVAATIAGLEKFTEQVVEVERRLVATEEKASAAQAVASKAESTANSTAANVLSDAQLVQHMGDVITRLEGEVEGLIKGSAEQHQEVQQMGTCFKQMTKRIGSWQAQVLQRLGESLARGSAAANGLCQKKEDLDVTTFGSPDDLQVDEDSVTRPASVQLPADPEADAAAADAGEEAGGQPNVGPHCGSIQEAASATVDPSPPEACAKDPSFVAAQPPAAADGGAWPTPREVKLSSVALRSDTPPPALRRSAMQGPWQRPFSLVFDPRGAVTPPTFSTAQKVSVSAVAMPSSPGARQIPHSHEGARQIPHPHEGARFIPTPLALHREQVISGISRLSASPGTTIHCEHMGLGERGLSQHPLPKHHNQTPPPPHAAPGTLGNPPAAVVQYPGTSAASAEAAPAPAQVSCQPRQLHGANQNPGAVSPDGMHGGCQQRPPPLGCGSAGVPGVPTRRTQQRCVSPTGSHLSMVPRSTSTTVWSSSGAGEQRSRG